MTETLTGKQVLALLAQDEVPEIECHFDDEWQQFKECLWTASALRVSSVKFRIKPAPAAQPLTDEQIYEMYNEPRSDAEMLEFARAIERHHGIGADK